MSVKVFLCELCQIELDEHDLDANLNTWGVFKCVCTDCIEYCIVDK